MDSRWRCKKACCLYSEVQFTIEEVYSVRNETNQTLLNSYAFLLNLYPIGNIIKHKLKKSCFLVIV